MASRIVIVLALLAAAAAAALPPVTGAVFEDRFRTAVDEIAQSGYVGADLVDYRRGLYGSDGVLTLVPSDAYLARLRSDIEDDGGSGAADEIIALASRGLSFDLDVNHGPVTIRGPAVVSLRARLRPDSPEVEAFLRRAGAPYLVELEATVDFDQWVDFVVDVPPMAVDDGDVLVDFSGLSLNGRYHHANGMIDLDGGSRLLDVESLLAGRLVLEDLRVGLNWRRLASPLWSGTTVASIEDLQYEVSGEGIAARGVTVDVALTPDGAAEAIAFSTRYRVGSLLLGEDGKLADLDVGLALANVDLEAAREYAAASQALALAADDAAAAALMPALYDAAVRVLRGSPRIEVDPVDFDFNDEPFLASAAVDLDGGALPVDLDPVMLGLDPTPLIAALSGAGHIEASEAMARQIAVRLARQRGSDAMAQPELGEAELAAQAGMMIEVLVAQGFVERGSEGLRASFRYADGALLVNGIPIPMAP